MADINVDDITNSGGTGVFDKLMESINSQIETQYLNNRITGADYANVYLGSVQAALSQSIQFALQEQLTEAQVDGVLADNVLKAKQLELATKDLEIKTYELANTLPAQLAKLQKDTDVTERQMLEAEATGVKQRLSIDKDIDVKERQTAVSESKLADDILTSTKQRTLLDTEEEAKQYEVDNLLPKQLEKITTDIDVTERQMLEAEATGTKQRILLDTEEEAKQYEVDNILPVQLEKLEEEVDLLQTQESEMLLDGAKKRIIMDEQIETENLQQVILGTEEELKTAQVKSTYADRVLKDKQAAKLGLDTVMKRSEDAKQAALDNDTSFVYTPNYEE
jgi:hypothetical protein